ncbi:hypothetical protein, partial [Aureimonas jatrophae]|uniref:hypothetical protein n=1 Tax=Aureimonas jatrophae TaxID=1166073 RepID=UPI0017DDCB06
NDLFRLVLLLSHLGILHRLESLLQGGPLFRGQTKPRIANPGNFERAMFSGGGTTGAGRASFAISCS